MVSKFHGPWAFNPLVKEALVIKSITHPSSLHFVPLNFVLIMSIALIFRGIKSCIIIINNKNHLT